jgi:hypothetical protein
MHHHTMLLLKQIFALEMAKEQLRQTAAVARQQQGSFDEETRGLIGFSVSQSYIYMFLGKQE